MRYLYVYLNYSVLSVPIYGILCIFLPFIYESLFSLTIIDNLDCFSLILLYCLIFTHRKNQWPFGSLAISTLLFLIFFSGFGIGYFF